MTRGTTRLSALLLFFGFAASFMAQARPYGASADSNLPRPAALRVDVDLVLVPVTVTDGRSRFVSGLQPGNFQLWEDKAEQEILHVSAEDAPISVGVILDMSGSMKDKLGVARDAATTFLRSVMNKDDEFFFVNFADRPHVAVDFTTEISRISGNLLAMEAKGMTALYDAVYVGLDKLRDGANAKKVLLLITDGEDNRSRYTFSNIREYVREQDVQVYAIGIVDQWNSQFAAGEVGRARIEELTKLTGGQSFFPDSIYGLEDICFKIGVEIKNQYVIAYRSTNSTPDGKWRKLRVSAHVKGTGDLRVRARSGYYAPADTTAIQ
jgi:Ca-activated chloride channel family protein